MNTITRKIALFQTKYTDSIACEDWAEGHEDYFRTTEFEEVEFKYLPKDETFIDEEIERITEDSLNQIAKLKQRKQELLSLEHQS